LVVGTGNYPSFEGVKHYQGRVNLLNPVGLLGLLTLPVILALHMLRERKRVYSISSLDLWSFLEIEVRGQKLRRIPFSWLLFVDLLIAVVISLAFAQPRVELLIPVHNARHVIILLDISSSMQANDLIPTRFAHARLEAISMINDLGPRDAATLIAFGAQPRLIGDTRVDSLQGLFANIEAISPGESGQSLKSALALAEASADAELPAEIFVLTDAAFEDPVLPASSTPIHWRVYGSEISNQAVLTIHASGTGSGKYQVYARLANYGTVSSSRLVTLIADGVPLHSSVIEIPQDTIISQVWPIVAGEPSTLTVSLTGNDALREDDFASTAWFSGEDIQVVLVLDPSVTNIVGGQVEKALRSIPKIGLRLVDIGEYSHLDPSDLTIFAGILPGAWPDGNVLVLDPPSGMLLLEIQDDLEPLTPPVLLNLENQVLAGVDFAGVRWGPNRVLLENILDEEIIARTKESPLYIQRKLSGTTLFVFLPDLKSGNLIRHPAFPILLGNQVQAARRSPFPEFVDSGDPIRLPEPDNYFSLTITSPSGQPVLFGGEWMDEWTNTNEPGIYHFELIEKSGKKSDNFVAVNSGNVLESHLTPQIWTQKYSGVLPSSSDDLSVRLDLMPWLLGLAVLLFLLEALMSWR
jgi:Ca-activated chloride channel homolog